MNALRSMLSLSRLRSLGPYLLVELLLPGGTLIALMLWVLQGGGRGAFAVTHDVAIAPVAIECVVTPELNAGRSFA